MGVDTGMETKVFVVIDMLFMAEREVGPFNSKEDAEAWAKHNVLLGVFWHLRFKDVPRQEPV
jgi:hypothetical protein